MKAIFSIDVEEWFHLLDTDAFDDVSKWDSYPSRVEETFVALLNILDKYHVKSTCFFVGWIAEKYPNLVLLAASKGHEIAVHGYYHRNASNQSYNDFYEDVAKTKLLLESIIGKQVCGFRAPSFSIDNRNLWTYKALINLGFKYSSSVHAAKYKAFGTQPKIIRYGNKEIVEIPLPVLPFPLTFLSCFGGGYFRLFPLWWFNLAKKLINNEPLTFYIHPRDIDLKHPYLKVSLIRRFKSLVNIKNTSQKIESILSQNDFVPFCEIIYEIMKGDLEQVVVSNEQEKQITEF